jgi:hypothetical protein
MMKSRRMGRTCSTHEEKRMDTGYWWEGQMDRDHYKGLDVGGRIILKFILKKHDRVIWTGFIWLRIGTSDGVI